MLKAENIMVRYGDKTAVDGVSFTAREGEWWMIVGPNGAGKSSLAGALSRGTPFGGKAFLEGKEIREYTGREYARRVGMLSQNHSNIYAFTVEEVVSLGRYAWHSGWFRGGDPEGEAKTEAALELAGLKDMRKRSMLSLSGGECQRVFLAQVMAQNPQVMILDEPANHLDLPFQQQLFGMIREWLKTPGRLAVTVTHDLSAAKKYGSHALLMNEGKAVSCGRIGEVMTRENLEAVYGMDIFGDMTDMMREWSEEGGVRS